MTNEEKNIKICEWLGYEKQTKELIWWNRAIGKYFSLKELPNHFTDLNAMHEAENKLAFATQGELYWRNLSTAIFGGDDDSIWECKYSIATANASQRAEAFGKTLNLW